MYFDPLAALHAPLVPILRHVLATMPLPRDGVALDLACGPGLKTPLLAEACGRGIRLIGIDNDRAAVQAARRTTNDERPLYGRPAGRPYKEARRQGDKETEQSTIYNLQSAISEDHGPRATGHWIAGDALALPLRGGCCAAAFCIAALGLFADRRAALYELRRVLRPRGLALLVVGTQAWAPLIRWRGELAMRVEEAYARALADGAPPLPASPDLSDELAGLLDEAGFDASLVRAFLLDITANDERRATNDERPGDKGTRRQGGQEMEQSAIFQINGQRTTDNGQRTTDRPLAAELPLLPWPALRSVLAGRLTVAQLARCDQLAAEAEIELCSLVLAAQTLAP